MRTVAPAGIDGSPSDVRAAEARLCDTWAGIPRQRLDRGPYLLLGSPAQMAEALSERREAYGLEWISLKEDGVDPMWFCREVMPLLTA